MEPIPLGALLGTTSATKRKDFCHRLHTDGFCLLWAEAHGVGGLEAAARRFFSRAAQDKEAAQVSARSSGHEPPGYVRLYDYELLQLRRGENGVGVLCAELAVLMNGFDFFHSTGLALLQILQHHWQTEPVPGETTNLMDLVTGGPSASLLRFVHYDRAVQQRAPFSDAEPSEGDTNSEEVFEDHKDFGLLTLVPISRVPGLHIWQAGPLGHDAQWIPVEEVYAPQRADATRNGLHLLVFCGETMDHATASYFPAVRHKVVLRPSQGPCGSLGRISSPFFLRALPDATVPRLHDRTATYSVSEFEADYDPDPLTNRVLCSAHFVAQDSGTSTTLHHKMDFGRGAAAGGVSLSAGPGSPYIPSESMVFLLSSHGLFLSAEPSGRVVADKEEPKEGETWYMTRTNQRVTLMSAHGKYLCAEPSGRLVADRDRPVVWEYFLIESHGSLVAFRSHHGKYVCAEPNYEVLANRIAVATYECWDVIPVLGYSLQPPTSRRPVIDHCQSLPIPPRSPTHQPQAHYGHHQQPQNQNQPQNQPHSAEHAYRPPPAHYHQPTSQYQQLPSPPGSQQPPHPSNYSHHQPSTHHQFQQQQQQQPQQQQPPQGGYQYQQPPLHQQYYQPPAAQYHQHYQPPPAYHHEQPHQPPPAHHQPHSGPPAEPQRPYPPPTAQYYQPPPAYRHEQPQHPSPAHHQPHSGPPAEQGRPDQYTAHQHPQPSAQHGHQQQQPPLYHLPPYPPSTSTTSHTCMKCRGEGGWGTFGACDRFDMHYKRPCPACKGDKSLPFKHYDCPKCGGLGGIGSLGVCDVLELLYKFPCPTCEGNCVLPTDQLAPCRKCKGKGGWGIFGPEELGSLHYRAPCDSCHGKCYT